MKYAVVNCDIYTGEQVLFDKAIVVNGERIEAIVDLDKVPKHLDVIDIGGLNIAPGFIDLQVNGGGGVLFNDELTEAGVSKIYDAHKRFGTTSFLPTLITTSVDRMLQAIEVVKSCTKNGKSGVLGLHIEGPYISRTKAGAHDKNNIRNISNDELRILLQTGREVIKVITVAPEAVKEDHIRLLVQNNIMVSAGHSEATYEQAMEAFKWGVSQTTHLFNAMTQFSSREPGLVGATLDSANVWAGIIADGFHVHFASIRICKRIKGKKLILVTDSMPPVGSKNSEFTLGDVKVQCRNGRCVTSDGTLAGSDLDMATAVRNCVQKTGISLDEALRMASTYTAEAIGSSDTLGRIKPGYMADMVIFNNQVVVEGIVARGEYQKVA
jgi:N-acetylglucosamine-6-phosphate deacetylase